MKFLSPLLVCFLSVIGTRAQVTSFVLDSAKFNKPIMTRLDSIYQKDQQPRLQLTEAMKSKRDVRIVDSLKLVIKQIDKENLIKVVAIIDQYGWLGPQKAGMEGSQALFLVIQHADLATQKRYLPLIKAAELHGEILSSNVAILEDRINMRSGKKQVYGSQAFTDGTTRKFYIYPIEDLNNLERKRKKMGLDPCQFIHKG